MCFSVSAKITLMLLIALVLIKVLVFIKMLVLMIMLVLFFILLTNAIFMLLTSLKIYINICHQMLFKTKFF